MLQTAVPDSVRLHAALDDAWRQLMVEFPEWATTAGYPGQNRRWTDYSPAGFERRRRVFTDISAASAASGAISSTRQTASATTSPWTTSPCS